MSNLVNILNNSISTQSVHSVHNGKFDKTRTGIVIGRGALPHRYDLIIDGHEYKNVPVYGGAILSKGDACKVTIPNNQMSQMFVMGQANHQVGDVIFNVNKKSPADSFGGIWKLLGNLTVGTTEVYGWQRIQ